MSQNQMVDAGVWPAMLTCLDDQGKPSQENIERLVELFVSQKVGGLFVLGSTGSGPALEVQTRKEVARMTTQAVAGRLPVMLHVGAVSPHAAVELAKHGQDIGVDAISTVAPIYYSANAAMLFAHYQLIASATSLPFYPYHFAAAGLPPVQEYVKRLLDLPNIRGLKVTDVNLYTLQMIRAYAGEALTIYSGADELVLPAMAAGAHGAIGSTYNFWAPAVIKARQAVARGDLQAGQRFMFVLGDVINQLLQNLASFYPFMRRVMQLRYGVEIGPCQTSFGILPGNLDDRTVLEYDRRVNEAAGL